jgi:hypothetical protein
LPVPNWIEIGGVSCVSFGNGDGAEVGVLEGAFDVAEVCVVDGAVDVVVTVVSFGAVAPRSQALALPALHADCNISALSPPPPPHAPMPRTPNRAQIFTSLKFNMYFPFSLLARLICHD